MKKFNLVLATLAIITIGSAFAEVNLEQYGFYHTQVNRLNSVTAFEQAIASDALIFVKIGASWCKPCRQLEPIVHQLAIEYPQILFIEVNLDTFRSLASRYGVRSIPTVLLFKQGALVSKTTGFKAKHFWINTIKNTFDL